ncbi:E3 ubiquitin-protein ligase RGLG4-like isoform X1 [Olea europaea var. sylvestris]|uniref:E3 ubiquitin-protein ligase RGLG4-like isoform X1 n=1 Tax=Olea europaea var. sylvestris TaxID=158386 RepID=UPI000C1D2E7C|nr:E3 ubiquitin-protein ligase RGLG4-like isoform X1 [Olea europaea var. sylvestris]XP_022868254.1 E3 ubiquitin-protein ligase RGLG4-like isoform X1 [Olea europaea var. sylvestris]
MGNIFGFRKIKGTNTARRGSITNNSVSPPSFPPSGFNFLNKNPNPFPSTAITDKGTSGVASSSGMDKKKKYGYIPDNFTSIDQVTVALREFGLESSNLILGIDFTKSNEWTGKVSFNNRSLHAVGDTPNPYEKAISIIGKTLAPFDEDNLIPCFGFGDATTHDREVFSFHSDHTSCHGFEEVLACYKRIISNLRLSGPTSYGPVVDAAVDIVERSGGQYHVLVIIADGQVTRSVDTSENELSPQESKTIDSIVNASLYPLSIILVGVGDGPWEDMRNFDDKIPAREFDNFQFVNFTAIMSKQASPSQKEASFALGALMEIPIQYQAAKELRLLGHVTGKAKKIVPRPPPVPYTSQVALPSREPGNASTPVQDDRTQVCPVCLTEAKDMAFNCGHMTCRDCSTRLSDCPICRQRITSRLRLYT